MELRASAVITFPVRSRDYRGCIPDASALGISAWAGQASAVLSLVRSAGRLRSFSLLSPRIALFLHIPQRISPIRPRRTSRRSEPSPCRILCKVLNQKSGAFSFRPR